MKQKDYDVHLPILHSHTYEADQLDVVPNHLKSVAEQVLSTSCKGEPTLIHGDYGPHNVLISNDLMSIIDWEWAAWGDPLVDVAWVVWFVHLHYPHFAKELSEVFLDSYKECSV